MALTNNLTCAICAQNFHKPPSRILSGANYCSLQCAGKGRALGNAASFWSKSLRNENGCLIWSQGVDKDGYGNVRFFGKNIRAHRLAWQLANSREIPGGMLVCHTCDTPSCVEPTHLFIGTDLDNQRDMVSKGRKAGQLPEALRIQIGRASGTYAEVSQRFNVAVQTVLTYRRLYVNKPSLEYYE